jgi:UDP-glucuronate decarboxylase
MKKILVTGGAGFLGSHLCERLINEGNKVYCVDNFQTGSIRNIEGLLSNRNFTLYEVDVKQQTFTDCFSLKPIDIIYNMACAASPIHYQNDPVDTMMTCVLGAKNVLSIAQKAKCRVVQASTSEVYGDPQVHPQTEEYCGNVNPIGPRACYDEGKRAAETLFFDYRRKYGVNTGVFRIFNTYGPRMAKNDGRVVSNFIVAALSDSPIQLYGDGTQTRSFCYVDDLVDGIIRFGNSDEIGPINLGNPGEFTIDELASMIVTKVSGGYKVYSPLPADDPKQRKPDISKAKERLGWEPKVPLEEGLDKTINYFRSIR